MSTLRIVYHLVRADFLERVRRYSFLIMLGMVVFISYQLAIGKPALTIRFYRGEFNSAWIGAMMTIGITTYLTILGFYLVKGAVSRDRETGVGQIMATTPLTKPLYLLGKWLSNFAVLIAIVAVPAFAGLLLQFWKGESTQVDLAAYLAPFLYIVLPIIGLVAAFAVLFESISYLQASFGNIVYFVMAATVVGYTRLCGNVRYPASEPTGACLFVSDMTPIIRKLVPGYNGTDYFYGMTGASGNIFIWKGVHWTLDLILVRFAFLVLAVLLVILAVRFFDRFDSARSKPRRSKHIATAIGILTSLRGTPLSDSESVPTVTPLQAPPVLHLTSLSTSAMRFGFVAVLRAELKLLLKGQRWWWYVGAGVLFIASLVESVHDVRNTILLLTWVWPILIWSKLGNREVWHNTQQMVFSSAVPLWRQLPAAWLAGFLVTCLTGIGVAVRWLAVGDGTALLAWISAALFIPSLALALGVWTNGRKSFEVAYLTILYLALKIPTPRLDFLGVLTDGNVDLFLPLSGLIIIAAFVGRARQLRG